MNIMSSNLCIKFDHFLYVNNLVNFSKIKDALEYLKMLSESAGK